MTLTPLLALTTDGKLSACETPPCASPESGQEGTVGNIGQSIGSEDMLTVEKRGGVVGFGGQHLKSRGKCDPKVLSPDHLDALEKLFAKDKPGATGAGTDPFTYYRITRQRHGREE